MASAAAARSTAAVAARAAAARHVASGTGRSSPLFPRRGFAAVTTTTTLPAAWTRPLPSHAAAAAPMPSATRLVRRGLAKISDNYFYHGSLNYVPLCWVDPDAPVDPATHFSHGEEDLASEEAMWALYERWCAFYGVKRSRDEHAPAVRGLQGNGAPHPRVQQVRCVLHHEARRKSRSHGRGARQVLPSWSNSF
uniref:Uncharacterized protein n=1 Tax=Setaria viridis TaxID=4556 RepID=A0A4U6VKZ3_SETVI|nr:uncharacterized protein LOC117850884 [Setaria viridis]TKW28893.1 hypothetical protein SEVIR_3G359201v2 [Setaria viridis]